MTTIGVYSHPQGEHFFWETRKRAEAAGRASDRGGRAGATAGKYLDGFVLIFADLINELKIEFLVAGTEKRYVTLPGYLRPVKDCDLVLTRRGELLAAVEFKRATDPSFGNNFNNRTEVAMGSSTDIRTAVEKGVYGRQEQFFLGSASWLKMHLSRIRRSGCRFRISTLRW